MSAKVIVEAALVAAGEPLSIQRLAALFEPEGRPAPADIQAALPVLDRLVEHLLLQLD